MKIHAPEIERRLDWVLLVVIPLFYAVPFFGSRLA